MSLEKRISTIRKAVEQMAVEKAEKENLEEPNDKHYVEAFSAYKSLRELNSDFFKSMIQLYAYRKETRDEIGAELFKTIDDRWEEMLKGPDGYAAKMLNALQEIKRSEKTTLEYKNEKIKLARKFVEEKIIQIKNDPQIVLAFAGKENLLDKATEFEKNYFEALLISYLRNFRRDTGSI